MADSQKQSKAPSKTARARSARLVAVQTLYGVMHTGEKVSDVVADILSRLDNLEVHGESLVKPNGVLFQKILYGVDERKNDLNDIIEANLKKDASKSGDVELLLKSILLCGCYELMAHHDIDAPIIINDYVDVAHGFYEDGQAKLINGVLDSIAKLLRDKA